MGKEFKKVYIVVVETGSYSDYRKSIEFVFDNEAAAQAMVDKKMKSLNEYRTALDAWRKRLDEAIPAGDNETLAQYRARSERTRQWYITNPPPKPLQFADEDTEWSIETLPVYELPEDAES